MLTTIEQNRLLELENIIQTGLEEFQKVGIALFEIKESKLYREKYNTFAEYCDSVWGLKLSKANYLSQVGSVIRSLGDGNLPSKQSYAFELAILKSDEYRQKAWNEVTQHDRITRLLVQSIARKYALIESESKLAKSVSEGSVSVEDAWELSNILYGEGSKMPQVPPYYIEPIEVFGIKEKVISPFAVRKLRWLEMFYPDETKSILVSGVLDNGREQIPLFDLQPRDIDHFKARLDYETIQTNVEVARDNQKELTKGLILDGFNIHEINQVNEGLVYIFPEGVYNHADLAKILQSAGLETLCVVAYKGNPEICFAENTKIRASQVNGVKPQPFMDLIKALEG